MGAAHRRRTSALIACCCVILVCSISIISVVHGFCGGQLSYNTSYAQKKFNSNNRRQRQRLWLKSSTAAPPENVIDTNTLLYQAYTTLTVKEVKDILRQQGIKVTGNKSELIDRLGQILDDNGKTKEDERHPTSYIATVKQKTLK